MMANESRSVLIFLRGLAVLAALISLTLLSAATAQALTWNVTQLTSNSIWDSAPKVSGNNIVWTGGGVQLYDGSSITQLSPQGWDVQISGDYVTWREHDGNDYEIFLYDGTTTTQLTNNSYDDTQARISDGNVVWLGDDGVDEEIYFYDGVSTTLISTSSKNNSNPQISGGNAVWQGRPDMFVFESQIYFYDGSSTTNISNDTRPNEDPQISGDNVVWSVDAGGVSYTDDYDIMFYDGTSVSSITSFDGDGDFEPQISGERVTWSIYDQYTDYENGADYEIGFWETGGSPTRVTNNTPFDDRYSKISDDLVVWQGEDGNDWEIFVDYGGVTHQLTTNSTDDLRPEVDGNTVVWYGHDGNDYEIFMATPCLLLGDCNCDGYITIGDELIPAFTNFTGPGSFVTPCSCGDVDCDGDIDVQDLLHLFGAFTGPPPDEAGLAAAEAGDPSVPDLIYDPVTGEVIIDPDGTAGVFGYVLKNGDNAFLAGNHTPILGGVSTSIPGEVSEAAFSPVTTSMSIGFVFPTGMDLAALSSYLTTNQVHHSSLGEPLAAFDLVVLTGAVPEPATVMLSLFGLIGLAAVAKRRRRIG